MKWTTGIKIAGLIALAGLMSGCAGTYLLENRVQAYSQLPIMPAAPTYRFERLPSQQHLAQGQLENMADAALAQAGLRRDDASPRFSVQVSARVQQVLSPWADPWGGWGWGMGWSRRHWGFGMYSELETPWYSREVAVIVRDLSSNKVVFESHAVSDGPWSDNVTILPAMFKAAMQGFPNPPPGPRAVNVQVRG